MNLSETNRLTIKYLLKFLWVELAVWTSEFRSGKDLKAIKDIGCTDSAKTLD